MVSTEEIGMCAKRSEVPATKVVKCSSCKGTGCLWTGASHTGSPMVDRFGERVKCPYCRGEKRRTITVVHSSHRMTEKRCEIIAPCGTPRFYSVRNCTRCGLEEWEHAAGHFLHGLQYRCKLSREEIG